MPMHPGNGTPLDDGDRSWEDCQIESIRQHPLGALDALEVQGRELDRLRARVAELEPIERRARMVAEDDGSRWPANVRRDARMILGGGQ